MIEAILLALIVVAILATVFGFIRRSSSLFALGAVSALIFGVLTIFSVGLLGLMLAIFDGVSAVALWQRHQPNRPFHERR